MLFKIKTLKKNILFRIIIITSFLNVLLPIFSLRRNSIVFGGETTSQTKKIDWEILEIKNRESIKWKLINENENIPINKIKELKANEPQILNKNGITIRSFNRSVVLNDNNSGPDVSFLVPLGFKSSIHNNFDFSIRGWNRRQKNSNLFAWNKGDAVAQIYYQIFNNKKSSFSINAGFRSIYSGELAGGTSPIGEGTSLGFRWDREISNNSGLSFGAEQLIQFDDKTDTGRDIYLAFSKGSYLNKDNLYPVAIYSAGIGTGYLALWDKTKFACTDLFDGAAVAENKYHQLCWGPFGAISIVFNKRFATFLEYNNYSFMLGSSYNPFNKVRLTFGLTLAEFNDNYKIKNLEEIRWFSRFSVGL